MMHRRGLSMMSIAMVALLALPMSEDKPARREPEPIPPPPPPDPEPMPVLMEDRSPYDVRSRAVLHDHPALPPGGVLVAQERQLARLHRSGTYGLDPFTSRYRASGTVHQPEAPSQLEEAARGNVDAAQAKRDRKAARRLRERG